MRILLALDGSTPSDVARDLVAGMSLVAGSRIRIISVLEPTGLLIGSPWVPYVPDGSAEMETAALHDLEHLVKGAAERLDHPGVAVETAVLRGHPATVIGDEARTFAADFVVVGSRGHGPFETLVLGSVSAELVDHAPCPVLIARRPSLGRVVLAHDGSAFSESAARVLRDWPLFAGTPIDVVSVMPQQRMWTPALDPAAGSAAAEAWQRATQEATTRHEEIATTAALELRRAGRDAHPVVLSGHPAASIAEHAAVTGADLIVVGTHGRTGLTRLRLGSVARSLVTHAPCSILVVRPRPAEEDLLERTVPMDSHALTGAGAW